jgi:hypothetical protein
VTTPSLFPDEADFWLAYHAGPAGMIPTLRTQLEERYGCEVIPDVSYEECKAVSARLVSSVPAARLAELAAAI